jgi:hypothetical protein
MAKDAELRIGDSQGHFLHLDEDPYAMGDYQDLVRKRFVKAWESLVDGYKAG